MATNTSKCNHLTPLHFKWLSSRLSVRACVCRFSFTSPGWTEIF